MASTKITGDDLFGNDVNQHFNEFNKNLDESATRVENLKNKILELNKAMKGAGGVVKLQAKMNEELKEYNALLKKSNKLEKKHVGNVVQLKTQTKALGNIQKQARNTTMRFGSSIRNLLGAAGFAGLTYSIFQAGRSIFDYTKKLDSMNLALEKVTKSTYEFGESKIFLSKMTDRLGLDLLKTAKSYTTFRAAAAQSNLTMGETTEIFESFADVGANLALTSSEMGSIFLALEQMLSKGKVSTEELRRQLGEKLPGAMGIMAEALGVTTGELDKMLRKGQVLSEDALPKFAKKVREVYGVDMKESVDTLAASQNRLTNAWIEFVELLNNNGNGIGALFQGGIEALTEMLRLSKEISLIFGERGPGSVFNVMEEAIGNTIEGISILIDGIGRFSTVIADITPPGWIYKLITGESLNEKFFGDGDGLEFNFDDWKAQIALEREQRLEAEKSREEAKRRKILVVELQRQTAILNEKVGEELVQQLDSYELNKLSNEEIKKKIEFLDKQNISIDKQRKAIEEATKAEEVRRKKRADSPQGLPTEQSAIETTAKNYAIMDAYWSRLQDLLRVKVVELEANAKKLREQIMLFPDDETARQELEKIEKQIIGFQSRIGSRIQPMDTGPLENRNNNRNPPTTDGPPQFLGTNLDDGPDSWTKRLEFAQNFLGEINKIEDAIFERRQQRIEEEEKAIEDKYNTLGRLAEGDEDLQKKLAIRREEEEKKIKKKKDKLKHDQAKAEKRQALIDIAINTAIAVAKVWGQTGIFGLAAQIPVLAMGALQAAVVAAQPLPEYAEGTDFHPGGPAVLGDGGKEELVFTPDGKTILTKDTPEVMDLPRGSKVISDAKDYIQKQVIQSIIDTDRRLDELVVSQVTKAVKNGFKGVNINNNVTVENKADFMAYRHNLLN